MAHAAQDQAAASGGVGLGDYRIHPERPLPGLSTGRNAAYCATSGERPDDAFFALVCDPAAQPRVDALPAVRKAAATALVTPVEWQVVDWPPGGRRNLVVVFERPADGRLIASLGESFTPLGEDAVTSDYLPPLVSALRALAVARIVHGVVNPTSILFRGSPRRGIMLGECVSSATASLQPAVFLPIEAALAAPAARGQGLLADDIFALGVTATCLLFGGNPVAGVADEALMRARIEIGSYGAIIGDRRVPAGMSEFLRGLLADDPKLRWNLDEIEEWLTSRRFVLRQGLPVRRATRPFVFGGRPYFVPRALSYGLAGSVESGVSVARSPELEMWAQRAIGDEVGAKLIKAAQSESVATGSPDQRDAALVSRICIALDVQAPIRYRGLAAAADGLGSLLAGAFLEQGPIQTIAEAIALRLPQFWLTTRKPPSAEHVALFKLFERLHTLIDDRRLGCGVERVLYELNPSLHCLSSLIERDHVHVLAGFLPAVERAAARIDSGELIDRHCAAYVAARFKTVAAEWVDALASGDPARRLAGVLRVMARLQAYGGPAATPNLVKWAARRAVPLIEAYHHRPTRRRLAEQLEKATQAGRLSELLLVIDNPVEAQRDARGFVDAKRAHAVVERELDRLATEATQRGEHVAMLAGQMSACFATAAAIAASLAAAVVLG
jgi:eukaryotic-like serine/threonine-protein kinase